MSMCDRCRMTTNRPCPLRNMLYEGGVQVGAQCLMHDAIELAVDDEVASLRKRVQRIQGEREPIPPELMRKPVTGQETQRALF